MDAKQQQDDELMVLESVYMTEFEALCRDYPNIQVKLTFPSIPEGAQHSIPQEYIFDVSLIAKLPANYPDELPELILEGLEEHMGQGANDKLLTELKMIAEQNLGMPSVYAVASELTDRIEKLIKTTIEDKEENELKARRQEEEAAFKEYEADKVTVESFTLWRKKFEQDTKHLREAAKKARLGNVEGRLSGKQMFLQDKVLELKLDEKDIPIEDDEKLVVDGVEIDESLYMDDIELPDSDED
uniref:RWD domain-containing protein n=1 Tax=Panagrolaimus sp. JU765 TaxID=591449 RepID=A0AC34R5P9_9BILA